MSRQDGAATAAGILERLDVPAGGVVYVQASMDWLRLLGVSASDVITALRERIAPGTLVMPAYPARAVHREYLAGRPTYDVRRSPVGVGLIPELFRRSPGVLRSLEPDYPVAAAGPDAEAITGGVPGDDPFGAASCYRRIIDLGGILVGLGVSLNTNSFIHVFDSVLEAEYPFPVYDEDRITVQVTTGSGGVIEVPRRVLRPEFQRLTKPGTIAPLIGEGAGFAAFSESSVQCFRWDLRQLESWVLAHARTRLAEGRRPCWLEGLP